MPLRLRGDWDSFKKELDGASPSSNEISQLADAIATRLNGKALSFYEVLAILGKEQIANSFYMVNAVTMTGGTTTTFTDQITYNYETVVTELRLVVGVDHAFTWTLLTDGKVQYTDPDVVQARYQFPFNFESFGQIRNAQNTVQNIATNQTGADAYFSVAMLGVNVPIEMWMALTKAYADTITRDLGFKTSPLHGVKAVGTR